MKKKSIIFLVFIAIMLCFALTACNNTPPAGLTSEQEEFYKTWQSTIQDETPITKVAMVGSHDSGISVTTSAFKGMTKTQDLTIGEQLKYGCRYFDIRVNKKKNGDLQFFIALILAVKNFWI